MEGGSLVAESLLAGAQGTEILGSLRINIKIKNKKNTVYGSATHGIKERIFKCNLLSLLNYPEGRGNYENISP